MVISGGIGSLGGGVTSVELMLGPLVISVVLGWRIVKTAFRRERQGTRMPDRDNTRRHRSERQVRRQDT
jgi:hypothetical protein